MIAAETTHLDIDTLNACLSDLPVCDAPCEKTKFAISHYLGKVLTVRSYANLDRDWKGMDDNEAWAN